MPDLEASVLTAEAALGGLLRALGWDLDDLRLDEALEELATPQVMLETLRGVGLTARLVHVGRQDLAHLSGPYLLELMAGGWCLVTGRQRARVALWQQSGENLWHSMPDLLAVGTGRVILAEVALPPRPLWEQLVTHVQVWRVPALQFLAAALLSNLIAMISPWLIRILVDRALPMGDESLLVLLTLGILLATGFRSLTYVLRERMVLSVTVALEAFLERGLLERILWLPFRQIQKRTAGDFLQAFGSLGAFADWLVTGNAATAFADGLMSCMFLAAMALAFPGATAMVLLITLGACGSALVMSRAIARRQKELVRRQTRQRGFMVEMLNGIQTLKATGSTPWAERQWQRLYRDERSVGLRKERLGLWSDLLLDLSLQVAMGTVLVWGGYFTLQGLSELGSLLGYLQITGLFMRAMLAFTRHVRILLGTLPEIRAVDQLLTLEPEDRPGRGPTSLPGPVVLDDVWFRYSPEGAWILRGVSLTVEPGRFKLLLAPSGFGKSTLLKVVAGLYAPDSGRISLGGVDARMASRFMTYLPQHTRLLSGTLWDNLLFFSAGASEDRIRQAAEESGLLEWIQRLPSGFETPVAQGGISLSGGQRQLVLLTAIMASHKTLVLMDETMANLDWVARNRILKSPLFQGRTILYASHEDPEGWKDVSMLADLEEG